MCMPGMVNPFHTHRMVTHPNQPFYSYTLWFVVNVRMECHRLHRHHMISMLGTITLYVLALDHVPPSF